MNKITSGHNLHNTLDILERSIIEYEYRFPSMLGYVGQVNKEQKKFWLANQTNVFFMGNGYGYNTYRRFEGIVRESISHGIVEGEFRLRPFTKGMICLHILSMITINILAIYLGLDFIESIKLILISVLSLIMPIFIIYRRIKETEKVEEETIEFIENILRMSEGAE